MILEKAFAKLHGSYEAIKSSDSSSALSILTGAPTLTMDHEDIDALGEAIKGHCEKGFILVGTTNQECIEGILDDHSYAIVDIHTINTEKGEIQLIKLRNPWGKGEWAGEWNSGSSSWTQEIKDQISYSEDETILYISLQDYAKQFATTSMCLYNDDFNQQSIQV